MQPLALLGPQRHRPSVAASLAAIGSKDGAVALVTAGWEEREDETYELAAHLGRPVVNLRLHRRAEEVFGADPELLEGYRTRRARLRAQSQLYRLRLEHQLDALHALERGSLAPDLAAIERAAALEMVRELDAHQAARVAAIDAEFEAAWRPRERDSLRVHLEAIRERVEACAAIALAGGHVAVLVHRLRLFDLGPLLATRPLVAWSAGAMVLSERIVLFHDDPPQGHGSPEVFGPGLGLCPGFVFLPHARQRLRLDDAGRVATLAQRFAPLTCVALEEDSGLRRAGTTWHGVAGGVSQLTLDGAVVPLALP